MKRRGFLAAGGMGSLAGMLRPRYLYAAQLAARHGEIYRQIGVRPSPANRR